MSKIDINNEVLQLEATERLESSLRTVNNLISMLNDAVIPESFEEKDKIELIKSNLNTYSNNLNSTYNLIKTGKKEIINSLEDQLEGYYKTDEYSIEDLEKYCNDWKESFKQKDYQSMENTMKKINRRLEKNKILEKTIEEARNI